MTLNYSQQILAQYESQMGMYERELPQSARVLRLVLSWLRDAKRIRLATTLPAGGMRPPTAAHYYQELLRLPEKVIAIEYDVERGVSDDRDRLTLASTRRVALAVEMDSENAISTKGLRNFEATEDDRGAILVLPIWWVDDMEQWEVSFCAAIIPRNQTRSRRVVDSAAGRLDPKGLRAGLRATLGALLPWARGRTLWIEYRSILPEIADGIAGDTRERAALNNCREELATLLAYLRGLPLNPSPGRAPT